VVLAAVELHLGVRAQNRQTFPPAPLLSPFLAFAPSRPPFSWAHFYARRRLIVMTSVP